MSQKCELIGVKTNLDKGLKFYAMEKDPPPTKKYD